MPAIFSKLSMLLHANEDSIFTFLTHLFSLKSLITLSLLFLVTSHYNKVVAKKNEPYIQSTWLPFFGHALRMGKDPIALMNELAKKAYEATNDYIFGMLLLGNRVFIITDPHSAEIVIRHSKDLSHVEFHNDILINFFNSNRDMIENHVLDDNLMRKYYLNFLLR